MVLYGPSFDVEQEAVLRTRAASRCGASPCGDPESIPDLLVVPDPRFVEAMASALHADTEVLSPGDDRRSPHDLSHGEHAALLRLGLRLESLEVPPDLRETEVAAVIRSILERSATVLWREFLASDFFPAMLYADDSDFPLGKCLRDSSRGVITRAVKKDRMVKDGSAEGTLQSIRNFVYDMSYRFRGALRFLARDVLRFESLRGDSPGDVDPLMKQRIGRVEVQRVSVEREMSRELFVRLVEGIVSSLGYPELEVGVLSVTQALTRHCSSLLFFPPFQDGKVQLFLPMSVYGTPSRPLTMGELFQLILTSLVSYVSEEDHTSFCYSSKIPLVSACLEDELTQLEFDFDGEALDVSVKNPLREKITLLLAADWQRVPLSPDSNNLNLICDDLAAQTGLSSPDVLVIVEKIFHAPFTFRWGRVAKLYDYFRANNIFPRYPVYDHLYTRRDSHQSVGDFMAMRAAA